MIVVKQKPVDEISAMVAQHRRVLVAGCNTCAAVSLVGGEKEVNRLIELLKLALSRQGSTVEFAGCVIQRQCEPEFVEDECTEGEFDAVLSLGCGAGVAHMSSVRDIPVYPAIDTLFIGSAKGMAHWQAECSACGSCVLGETAGICPVTRCAKGIMNGPCGGVDDGTCELGDRPCAWVEIYDRQEALNCSERFDETLEPRDDSVRTKTCEWEIDPEGGSK
jgi:hypothetical protein